MSYHRVFVVVFSAALDGLGFMSPPYRSPPRFACVQPLYTRADERREDGHDDEGDHALAELWGIGGRVWAVVSMGYDTERIVQKECGSLWEDCCLKENCGILTKHQPPPRGEDVAADVHARERDRAQLLIVRARGVAPGEVGRLSGVAGKVVSTVKVAFCVSELQVQVKQSLTPRH